MLNIHDIQALSILATRYSWIHFHRFSFFPSARREWIEFEIQNKRKLFSQAATESWMWKDSDDDDISSWIRFNFRDILSLSCEGGTSQVTTIAVHKSKQIRRRFQVIPKPAARKKNVKDALNKKWCWEFRQIYSGTENPELPQNGVEKGQNKNDGKQKKNNTTPRRYLQQSPRERKMWI